MMSQPVEEPDQTIEILMSELDPEVRRSCDSWDL
jgi:hypothetical protein